ncbi:7-aminocholesterol resistance protein RTA1 [Purpureocillium lavendulum]|uniref:7-aminocholesterol resistance protein RTA1 n=1 Tax=Purpureocillium lavendulum TaxID=1247861 RepID=A0AB34FFH8_9HYPO|nr:7-aminocholesterol resistance protein RTA1 [Purpureocillium lavendulum]
MQAVPTLVGTGTAVAAAATGLVFGQSSEPNPPATARGATHARTLSTDRVLDLDAAPRPSTSFSPVRPATTSASPSLAAAADYSYAPALALSPRDTVSRPPLSRYQRPQSSQLSSPRGSVRRHSFLRHHGDLSPLAVAEESRESLASNGSWIRRLSMRPLSQHGSSNRSSIIADSTSVAYSLSSTSPILARSSSTAPPLPPNKLVKRTPSTRPAEAGGSPVRRSKGHLPTLRRPATSHQRSATLQQFRADIDVAGSAAHPKYSFEQPICPEELLGASPIERAPETQARFAWKSFFHLRRTTNSAASATTGATGPSVGTSSIARLCPDRGLRQRAYLLKPSMISAPLAPGLAPTPMRAEEAAGRLPPPDTPKGLRPSPEIIAAPPTRTKRSLSASFSTAANNWVLKTSGSLRRPKRGVEQHNTDQGGNKRHVSAPVSGSPASVVRHQHQHQQEQQAPHHHHIIHHHHQGSSTTPEKSASAPIAPNAQGSALGSAASSQRPSHKRNTSSPLPPLSISSPAVGFHDDLSRSGGARHGRPNQPSGSSTSSAAMSQLRGSHYERSSVQESSDGDGRGFTSGDDDDTDFKSDTVFDSLRTLSSGRVRAVETPLESVYDESPPSTAGNGNANGRTKRLSIHEMLGGRGWDGGIKIMEEEDEASPTPVRATKHAGTNFTLHHIDARADEPRFSLESSHNAVSQPARDLGRFSIDDDFDEDWTRDDDGPFNALSPPSQGNSVTARGMNPNVRLALASIEGDAVPRLRGDAHRSERPLSNLFDWSEPPAHDKQDANGTGLRPRTSYAMPEADLRGGRSAIRKVPAPLHVRSQSVPVVHDLNDESKPMGAKYGTWGMGTKTVSEDWDEDFEFGGAGGGDHDDKGAGEVFAVPESIRATQPSVRAHSGQIRELSLLVNDLKRLCRHGRELNMLSGDQRALWKEAEGIIALASPDEDDVNEDHQSIASAANMDAFDINERLVEDGYDAASLDRLDAAIDSQEPAMSRTAVVRERQSPRRRSVFSPEDDIFGGNWPLTDGDVHSARPSRPRTPDNRPPKPNDVTGMVRSVMESVQNHRPPPEPMPSPRTNNNSRVHFDTNSLKALVKRAGELRDILSDSIRREDQITQSPARTPRHERRLESSPAFTRVFDDPGSSPPRRSALKNRATTSIMESQTPEKSPSSAMGRRVPMMTVG